jgi:hypothetical protein
MDAPQQLLYRASGPLARARMIRIERPGGRVFAWIRREDADDGRAIWCWTGGGVPDFAIEDEGGFESFLVTRTDGAPFGRFARRGFLRPRLEATDARSVQLVVEADGLLCGPQGRELGRVDLESSSRLRLTSRAVRDQTLRSLVLATPICHAAQGLLLLS